MVVGGGLEEDVCEVKDTTKQTKGYGSRPVPLTVGERDLPDPFIRRSRLWSPHGGLANVVKAPW
jgi:hypothetical protein